MTYLHDEMQLLHLDLKSNNVLIDDELNAKVRGGGGGGRDGRGCITKGGEGKLEQKGRLCMFQFSNHTHTS